MRARNPHPWSLFAVVLFLVVASTGCDSDNGEIEIDIDDPDTLIGSYTLVSVVDKNGDLGGPPGTMYEAGEPVTISISEDGEVFQVNVTIEGSLQFMTERYAFSLTFTTSAVGFPPSSDTQTGQGTWSVSGGTLTLDDDDPESEVETLQISADGNRITVEDDTARFVFRRQ